MSTLDGDVALILLAAGKSSRFGGRKLTASLDGKPVWEWSASAAERAGFVARYLVVGPDWPGEPRAEWTTVLNANAASGIGASIAAGVEAASSSKRIVIALADMPLMQPNHLRRLGESRGNVFTRQRGGAAGTPAAFDRSAYSALRSLNGDRGASSLALDYTEIVAPEDERILSDIDTRADLAAISLGRV